MNAKWHAQVDFFRLGYDATLFSERESHFTFITRSAEAILWIIISELRMKSSSFHVCTMSAATIILQLRMLVNTYWTRDHDHEYVHLTIKSRVYFFSFCSRFLLNSMFIVQCRRKYLNDVVLRGRIDGETEFSIERT